MKDRPSPSDPLFDADGLLTGAAPKPANNNHPNESASHSPWLTKDGGGSGFTAAAARPCPSYICLAAVEPLLDQVERHFPERDPMDLQFIERVARSPMADGKTAVRNHHTVRFMRKFGPALHKLEPHLAEMEANDGALRTAAGNLQTALDATPRYVETPGGGVPWTAWPRCKVGFILLAAFLFILVETSSVATTLRESGIPSFLDPLRAWFFTSVPLGLALLLKLMRDWLHEKVDRRIHALTIGTLGIIFGGWWLWLFASTFPGIAQSLGDVTAAFSLTAPEAADNRPNAWLIFTGLAAAACVAAVAWSAAEDMVQRHQTSRRIDNQPYLKIQGDLDALRPVIESQAVVLHRTRKLVERIHHEHQDCLAEAEALYREYEAAAGYERAAHARLYGKSNF